MLIVRRKCTSSRPADLTVVLAFGERQQTRLRSTTTTGEEIGFLLPRGTALLGGDRFETDDGRVVQIEAATESLCEVRAADPHALARAAYHLGNRHAPMEIGTGFLRFGRDSVLADLMRHLGLEVRHVEAHFVPESGAYATPAMAPPHDHGHRGVIHDHAPPEGPR
ncbi:MAG: urease accessory protein UreE [Casimicrobiaceae bacterium]